MAKTFTLGRSVCCLGHRWFTSGLGSQIGTSEGLNPSQRLKLGKIGDHGKLTGVKGRRLIVGY